MPKCHLEVTIKVLPLRLLCTVTAVHSVTKEKMKTNYFKQNSFLQGFFSWLNRSLHNSILTTAIVNFQNSFFNSDRKHLCLNFTILELSILFMPFVDYKLKSEIFISIFNKY